MLQLSDKFLVIYVPLSDQSAKGPRNSYNYVALEKLTCSNFVNKP